MRSARLPAAAALLASLALCVARPAPCRAGDLEAALGPHLRAVLAPDEGFRLEVRARPGDGWWAMTERAGAEPSRWKAVRAASGRASPVAGDWYRVPSSAWSAGTGQRLVSALLPETRPRDGGWAHVVAGPERLGRPESPWLIARAFTGNGRRHEELRRPDRPLRPGDVVHVPREAVLPALRPRTESSESPPARTLDAPDGFDTTGGMAEMSEEPEVFVVRPGTRSDDGALEYVTEGEQAFAAYRLKAGETLYSDVVLRFTGRLGGRYVNDAALRYARLSGVADVTDIPVGQPIRIPIEDLRPEHLPPDHPRRRRWEAGRAATARLAALPPRRGLEGVHVLLDVGHGGGDPGALSGNVWEDDYAYDIAARIHAVLTERTHARVHPFVDDASTGLAPLSRIARDTDELLLTTPPLKLDSGVPSSVAVNLRWMLANDRRRALLQEGASDDQLVFLSIHADSLHRSARGAMAYYPEARYRVARARVSAARAYRRHAEARPANAFKMTRREMLRSEGLSRRLGTAIVESVREAGLPVHGFSPVRGHVVRRKAWVPAVLRYNRVPAAVLLEACNLNNPDDQRSLRDPAFRQGFAEAVVDGLARYFAGTDATASARDAGGGADSARAGG